MQPLPTIRNEQADDITRIHDLVSAAFERSGEADLVDALRRANSLTLSLVAEVAGQIVGHVGFSPITIEDRPGLALAPVAVAADWRRQGIAAALIRRGLGECRRQQHTIVIVVGDPHYYRRFGFVPAGPFGIQCPFAVPAEAHMVLELAPGAAHKYRGMVRYRPEFDAV